VGAVATEVAGAAAGWSFGDSEREQPESPTETARAAGQREDKRESGIMGIHYLFGAA